MLSEAKLLTDVGLLIVTAVFPDNTLRPLLRLLLLLIVPVVLVDVIEPFLSRALLPSVVVSSPATVSPTRSSKEIAGVTVTLLLLNSWPCGR